MNAAELKLGMAVRFRNKPAVVVKHYGVMDAVRIKWFDGEDVITTPDKLAVKGDRAEKRANAAQGRARERANRVGEIRLAIAAGAKTIGEICAMLDSWPGPVAMRIRHWPELKDVKEKLK